MIVLLSSATFFIVGVFLFLIGIVMMSDPRQMLTILRRMGSTPQIHFTELGLRFLAGAAFFIFAEQTPYARGFQIAGVFLMATSVLIMCVPHRFHNAYALWWADRLPPTFVRFLGLLPIVIGAWLILLNE